MKKQELTEALNLIMLAVGQKFGGGEGAKVIISDEGVSVDDPEGNILLEEGTADEAAAKLLAR